MLNLKHLYGFIWYAQRDSNPHRLLRRQLLYPAELWAHIIIKDIIIYLGNKIKYTIYKLYNIYFLKVTKTRILIFLTYYNRKRAIGPHSAGIARKILPSKEIFWISFEVLVAKRIISFSPALSRKALRDFNSSSL